MTIDWPSGDQSLRPRMAGKFVTLRKPLPFTLTANNWLAPSRSEANRSCLPSGDQVASQPRSCGIFPALSPLRPISQIWYWFEFGAQRVNVIVSPSGDSSAAVRTPSLFVNRTAFPSARFISYISWTFASRKAEYRTLPPSGDKEAYQCCRVLSVVSRLQPEPSAFMMQT